MGLKQLEKTCVNVGGLEFYISPFPAFKAANLSGELADVLAPIFAALVPLIGELGDDTEDGKGLDTDLKDIDLSKASSAIAGIHVSVDRMEVLMKKLLLGGNIVVKLPDGTGNYDPQTLNEDIANEIFCGNIQDMFVLCFKVIQINFSGFFGKLGSLSGKVKFPATTMTAPRVIL